MKLSDQKVYYSTYHFPIGQTFIASTDKGICALFQSNRFDPFHKWLQKRFKPENIIEDQEYNRHVETQLQDYFSSQRSQFDLPLDLRGTEFQQKVWAELQKIPHGQTITYKELAIRVGGSNYTRAVGGANNKNPVSVIVPCHRVVGSNGKLVGYAGGIEMKSQLLQLEQGGLFSPNVEYI